MRMEAESGPFHAASSASPKVGSVQSLPSTPSATDGTIPAWYPAARALQGVVGTVEGIRTVPSWTKQMGVKSGTRYIHLC